MQTSKLCGSCGKLIPPDAPAGQCPWCLLEMAGEEEESTDILSAPWFTSAERLFGGYMLGRQIGAGGMGVVYEALEISQNHKVAIKVIRDAHGASPVQLCRFTIETEAAARLNHPNIVRVHQAGECNGHPFFSMDLIEGESLGAKIKKKEFPFDWAAANGSSSETRRRLEAVVRLMIKVALAVHHAHERGVLHRDLKPGNILIDQNSEPHLTDFGLAKILQPSLQESHRVLTTAANLPGTANYISPEQVAGQEATGASDIYGLGAVLYELLTGRPPFGGATPFETFKQIAEDQPIRPRRLNACIPSDLETICLKCLEKDPRHRFISAKALAADLEHWLQGQPIRAQPPTLMRRVSQWTRRNLIGSALIVSLCLGLMASLTLLKIVNDQRMKITLDQYQNFEDSMYKISLIWSEAGRTEVMITPRELAILAGRPTGDFLHATHKLCFGISVEASISAMAQGYAQFLSHLQEEMQKELGESVSFSLKLFKWSNSGHKFLAHGDADIMVLSAVDYLKAKAKVPEVRPIAREKFIRDAVIFAHADCGIQHLPKLAGKSIAFPDPALAISIWAKARLFHAGLEGANFRSWLSITNLGPANPEQINSLYETVNQVLTRKVDAGVAYRDRFERFKHAGLVMLDHFPDTPNVIAASKGVDPAIIKAMQKVIHLFKGKPGFDNMVLEVPGAMVPVDDAYFEALRQAMGEAEKFEGQFRPNN